MPTPVPRKVVEEKQPMATADCASDLIATLAQKTARKVGCQAVRWWQDKYNPRRLYIEVNYTLANGQPFPVWISAPIPGQLEVNCQAEHHTAPRADAPSLSLTKPPRGCPDFVTPGAQSTPAP